MATTYNAGIVTAYGAAVRGGYTGTYEEYCEEQAHIGTNAQRAESAADNAEAAAQDATESAETLSGSVAQIATNKQDITVLKEELNSYGIKSFNRFDKDNTSNITGSTLSKNTGALTSGSSFGVSDYIDISDISPKIITSYVVVLCFYDDTKTFIAESGHQYSSYATQDYTEDVPSGAKYARISYKLTDIDLAQIGESVSRTSYVSYDGRFSFDKLQTKVDDTLSKKGVAADAKKTGDEIFGLREELSVLNSFSVTWNQGNIIESNGASGGSAGSLYSKRLRTVLIEVPDGGFAVDLPDNIQMQLYWYNTNATSSYVGCDTLGDISNLDSPRGAYVRFVLAYSDPTLAITPRDADVANVHLYTHALTDTSLTLSGKAADAKATGDAIRAAVPAVITVDVNGGADYTSLTRAIYDNVDTGETIMVKPGTYDIVQEYVDLFGQSVVDSLADSTDLGGFQYGIRILNRKVIFQPGSHVVCDWTGHTVNGTHRFSAFAVAYNAEIEGLDLDSTATFYAIHDDYGTYREYYKNIYRNCRLIGHNLVNQNVIGGGCKPYSRTIIENCYVDNNASGTCVRYHNTNLSQAAEPVVWVSNSYFAQALSFRWYGTQTTKMTAYVNNCHAASITKGAEGSSTNDNVDLIMWNNETA